MICFTPKLKEKKNSVRIGVSKFTVYKVLVETTYIVDSILNGRYDRFIAKTRDVKKYFRQSIQLK